jgi:hypothetical protein
MNAEHLTTTLAKLVMGWRVVADRFLMGNRQWMPRWRFQPVKRIADAVRLLEKAAPESCVMDCDENGMFHVRVRLAGKTGEAHEKSKARAISYAIARALGLEVDHEASGDRGDGI